MIADVSIKYRAKFRKDRKNMEQFHTQPSIEEALQRLELRHRRQFWALVVLAVLWLSTVAALVWPRIEVTHAQSTSPNSIQSISSNSILRVRGLVVQDENGVDRVWIGAPWINPMVLGKRYKRSVNGAGILILDPEGNERGGYGTFDGGNANLSIDSVGDEQADFGAGSDGGPTMSLQNGNGNGVAITVTNSPKMLMAHDNKLVFEAPSTPAQKKNGGDR